MIAWAEFSVFRYKAIAMGVLLIVAVSQSAFPQDISRSIIPPPPVLPLPGSETFFGEKGFPEKTTQATQDVNDPEHASNPVTGQNLFWDGVKKTWVDAMTGKALGFHGARSKKPCASKPGCTDIGMTTPGPGQDAASKLAPARIIQGGTSSGFASEIKTPPGLSTIIFTTERSNRIEVYMPNRLFHGKTFSGSMKVIFKNPADQNELTGYAIRIGDQQTALSNGVFSAALPSAAVQSTTDLVLVDKKGKQKAGVSLPVYPALPSLPQEFDLPRSGTSGDLILVQGPIGGAIGPTDYIKIGGNNIQLLAKSEGQLVALNMNDAPGLTEIESKINGSVAKSTFRNLTLKIWADKYHLLKGEGTTVHMLVSGLEKLETPASMTIDTTGTVIANEATLLTCRNLRGSTGRCSGTVQACLASHVYDEGYFFTWERFGKEVRFHYCPLSRTESTGREF
jgi:hypothetical protein